MIDPIFLVLTRPILCVSGIVHGQRFGLGAAEDTQDTDGNGLCRHGGSPVLTQEGQANVPIRVHVFMDGNMGR